MRETNHEEWEIVSTYEIMRALSDHGFENINRLKCFENGKPYYSVNGKIYLNQEYEDFKKVQLDTNENIAMATALLAQFHKLAIGFEKPAGTRIKTEWGRLVERYKLMLIKLRKFYKCIDTESYQRAGFINMAMEHKEEILGRAEISEKLFKSDEYLVCLEGSMRKKEIGIVDFNESTFVSANGRVMLSSIFDVSYNMIVEDLAKFIRKCCEKTQNTQIRDIILTEYTKIQPIGSVELDMLDGIMDFPYDCIKYILKFQQNTSKDEQLSAKFTRSCGMELKIRPWRREIDGI